MLRKALLVGTTLGLATILSMGISNAQQPQEPDQQMERLQKDMRGNECANPEDCPSARENRRERRARDRDDDGQMNNANQDTQRYRDRDNDRREARNWRYDSRHHRRSRHRDATFRFYFGGYYYPEPYWDMPVVVIGNRVSCREGRNIVDDSGFNRVRTVECSGRNYTYTGRRHGDMFRIVLNSRSGRIVSVREL